MKIAIFSDNFYPELSGIADSIISLAKELAKRGHLINFYVPQYSAKDYSVAGLKKEELNLGEKIKIIRFFSFPYPGPTKQGRFILPLGLRVFKIKKFNPDIIHSQLFFGMGLEALFAAKILKKPLVGTNHTAITEYLKYSPLRGRWLENFSLNYVNWYYHQCQLLTAPSRSVIDEMLQHGFKGEWHVISNPIDTQTFCPLPNKNWLKKKFNLSEQTIIHAGRLAEERNIDVIIKSLSIIKKQIPGIRLALAGKGAAEEKLKALTNSLRLKENVTFLGFLDKTTLNEAYNASKIFVITSTSDTQSMVMMQAMAAGLPIVGVKARALPEYINKQNGLIVEPNNEKKLAEKTILLLKDSTRRRRLGQGARKFALNFSAASIAAEWEVIYKKLIEAYNSGK